MPFQILTPNKEALSMRDLDAEAAALWNKPVNEKYYAAPFPRKEGDIFGTSEGTNWFDSLGWKIHTAPKLGEVKWSDLITAYYQSAGELAEGEGDSYERYVQVYKPYIDLINHWASKGYTAHRVEG